MSVYKVSTCMPCLFVCVCVCACMRMRVCVSVMACAWVACLQVVLCVWVWPRRMDDFEAKNFAKYRVPFYICLNNTYIFFFGVCSPLAPVRLIYCDGVRRCKMSEFASMKVLFGVF